MNETTNPLNLESVRKYWRSLDELASVDGFKEFLHREFPRQASEWIDDEGRRNFLKIMGASLALAGLSACTKQPTEFTMPYVEAPEQLIPGKPLYYATAFPIKGIANPVLVETHAFRPTKVEGNPAHPASLGSADVPTQGSILGLYDPDRLQTVNYIDEVRSYASFLESFINALAKAASENWLWHQDFDRDRYFADALWPDSGRSEALSGRKVVSVGTHRARPPHGDTDGVRAVPESCL